jgi:hypothetical protein
MTKSCYPVEVLDQGLGDGGDNRSRMISESERENDQLEPCWRCRKSSAYSDGWDSVVIA